MTLQSAYPNLVPKDGDLDQCMIELEDAYLDYVTHVSPPMMAISLETAAFILRSCVETCPRTVIDFGSGFTSYVLRYYASRTAQHVECWSVDDNDSWLEWTGRFLDRYDLKREQFVRWPADVLAEYDLVVYDFSGGVVRNENFGTAFDLIAPCGIAILDDAQHERHQEIMYEECRKRRYDIFGLQEWTTDFRQRYAALVVRP